MLGSGSEGGMAATVVGTPHYLSPELVHGRAYDQKSDIWALGCVLYEITCLHKPFDASNIPGIIMKYVASPAAAVCRLVCVSGCMSVWLLRVCTVRVCACLRVFRVWCHFFTCEVCAHRASATVRAMSTRVPASRYLLRQ